MANQASEFLSGYYVRLNRRAARRADYHNRVRIELTGDYLLIPWRNGFAKRRDFRRGRIREIRFHRGKIGLCPIGRMPQSTW